MKLSRNFYNRDTRLVAEELIGKILVHVSSEVILSGRITETEAYIGAIDKACHCYNGKMTKRTKVMFGQPGRSYIYLIYGIYYCFNIVTEKEGNGSAVLIRGLEPKNGISEMCKNRYGNSIEEITKKQLSNLSNGPGKLCKALNITKNENNLDITKNKLYVIDDGYKDFKIIKAKRVNIDYAEEAKDFLWRNILISN